MNDRLADIKRRLGDSRRRLGELADRLAGLAARAGAGPGGEPGEAEREPAARAEAPLGSADIEGLEMKFELLGVDGGPSGKPPEG